MKNFIVLGNGFKTNKNTDDNPDLPIDFENPDHESKV
jgi:hypothetical protein